MAQDYIKVISSHELPRSYGRLNDNFRTVLTSNSGSNALSSPKEGNLWLQVGDPSILHVYKNGDWAKVLDDTNTTKQNQNSRLDAIADADAVESSSFIPVYSSDSVVTFREAGTSGLSILQSASAAGATFVTEESLSSATDMSEGLVGLARTDGTTDSDHVLYTGTVVDSDGAVTPGHLNRRTLKSELFTLAVDAEHKEPHYLGSTPRWFRLVAVCIEASYGHSVGDELDVEYKYSGDFVTVYVNSSSVGIRTDYHISINTVSNGYQDIHNSDSWKFRIYAGI